MLGWCSEEQYVNAFMNAVSTVYVYVNVINMTVRCGCADSLSV